MAISKTPPMGWNAWNTFGFDINEELIKQTADAMVESGLADAGYKYVVMDDGWQVDRDENGVIVADKEKFPNGIKAVADYVHSKGLLFGLYSCAGMLTCGSRPGSFQHEFQDAQTYADWGVDFLKYDNCHKPLGIDDHLLYRRMAMALRATGRDILFSACSWGEYDTLQWARQCGSHMWRSTCDIADNWESMKNIALSQFENTPYNGTYSFNDMDMLIVGMGGKGHVSIGGCTDEEYQTHFALWALMMSPLMMGCDIRNLSEKAKEILTNKELIAINQDIECRPPYCYKSSKDHEFYAAVKLLSNGDYAIGIFNFSDEERQGNIPNNFNVKFWDFGMPIDSGYGFEIRDVINHKDLGVAKEFVTAQVKPHGCAVFRAKLKKL